MKSSIGLFFMIDSWIPKLKNIRRWGQCGNSKYWLISVLTGILGLSPVPAIASSVEINNVLLRSKEVTLRVQVLNDDRSPNGSLKRENFLVTTTNSKGQQSALKNREIQVVQPENQQNPDPTYLVILLDMSGSMSRNDPGSDQSKLKAAVEGIRAFIQEAHNENLPVQISLVPFGDPGKGNCNYYYAVNPEVIQANFLDVRDNYLELDKKLESYSTVDVCALTNIYEPLGEAVKYLGESEQLLNDDNQEIYQRLSVILLSDGFHVVDRHNEVEQFNTLLNVLDTYPHVEIHALAYGESLKDLRDRTACPVRDDELSVDTVRSQCVIYENGKNRISNFIVDEARLAEITQNRGIFRLSENAEQVKTDLIQFLTALRAYEITFAQPYADRATKHETAIILQTLNNQKLDGISSEKITYRMPNLNFSTLSLIERLSILGGTIILGFTGIGLFSTWSKDLKKRADY